MDGFLVYRGNWVLIRFSVRILEPFQVSLDILYASLRKQTTGGSLGGALATSIPYFQIVFFIPQALATWSPSS